MGRLILIDVVVAGLFFVVWYAWFVHYNRRRAADVLRWVQAACLGKGNIADLRWFEDTRLTIRLLPRPLPLQWAVSRWRRQQETLTFEADMGFPPGFHLDIIRHRWSGHSGARPPGAKAAGSKGSKISTGSGAWTISRPGPVILTTKEDWPVELSPVVNPPRRTLLPPWLWRTSATRKRQPPCSACSASSRPAVPLNSTKRAADSERERDGASPVSTRHRFRATLLCG